MATGTRSTPARKAARISQKVQRHRRITPMPSSVMKPSSAARKAISKEEEEEEEEERPAAPAWWAARTAQARDGTPEVARHRLP